MITEYLKLWLGTLAISVAIGFMISRCMDAAARPQKTLLLRRLVAASALVPTIILLLGLGFATPMPGTIAATHQLALSGRSAPFGNAAATTACIVLLVYQIPALVYIGIAYARRAGGPAPVATAGVVFGCVFLGVITLLAVLAAGQSLAGASL